LEPV
jgi:hypothetical protein